jgi:hypothetical protein
MREPAEHEAEHGRAAHDDREDEAHRERAPEEVREPGLPRRGLARIALDDDDARVLGERQIDVGLALPPARLPAMNSSNSSRRSTPSHGWPALYGKLFGSLMPRAT